MYGLGAVLGPKAAGMLAGSGMGFRHIYLLTVPLVLLIFVPALFTRFPDADTAGPEAAAGEAPRFTAALRTPAVWLFGLTLGLMMGVEMASSNWGGLYFQDVYGMDPAGAGADFVAAFFAAFTLSRLVSGFLIEKIGYMRSLIGAGFVNNRRHPQRHSNRFYQETAGRFPAGTHPA
jgi:fucose permease